MATILFNCSRATDIKLPDFNQITKRIEQENVLNDQLNLPHLKQYNESRKIFELQGFQHNMTCLLKAFCFELQSCHQPLRDFPLLRSTSLFCTLLMFREFEIVMWANFCCPDTIAGLIKEHEGSPDVLKKNLMNYLLNTAYFTKRQVTSDDEFHKYQAFFDKNFQIFQGRHTDWLLLNEPDISQITPMTINSRYQELIDIYWIEVSRDTEQNSVVQDFNELTNQLVFDQTRQIDSQAKRQKDKLDLKNKDQVSPLKKRRKHGISEAKLKQYVEKSPEYHGRALVMQDLKNAEIGREELFLNEPLKPFDPQPFFREQVQTPPIMQPFAGDFLTKTVSNMIVKRGNTSNQKPNRVADGANFNESLLWQTMQSRIQDMNTIMKQIEEPCASHVKNNNQRNFNFDPSAYHNTGSGSQIIGQNLYGHIKTSSIIALNQHYTTPTGITSPHRHFNTNPQNPQNSLLQFNSQIYQNPQHTMSYYLGLQGGTSGQNNLPTQQSSRFLKNSFQQVINPSFSAGQQTLTSESPGAQQDVESSGVLVQPKAQPILSDLFGSKSPTKSLCIPSFLTQAQPNCESKPNGKQAASMLLYQQQQFMKKESQTYYPPSLAKLRNQVREQCLKQVNGKEKNFDSI